MIRLSVGWERMGGGNFSSQDGWPEGGGTVTAMTGKRRRRAEALCAASGRVQSKVRRMVERRGGGGLRFTRIGNVRMLGWRGRGGGRTRWQIRIFTDERAGQVYIYKYIDIYIYEIGRGEDGCLVGIARPITKLHAGSEAAEGRGWQAEGQVQAQRQAGVEAGR